MKFVAPIKQVGKLKEDLTVFMRSLTVGGIASAISKTAVSPIDRAKVILQTQGRHPDIPIEQRYRGLRDILVRLWGDQPVGRKTWVKPLVYWRGNGVNVLRYFPLQAIGFACKDRLKRIFLPKGQDFGFGRSLVGNCAAGGLAGVCGLSVIYPLDLARTKFAADVGDRRKYKGLGDCLKKTYKGGGLKHVYKGYAVSAIGIFPYRAVYFGGYDLAKKYLMKGKPEDCSFAFKFAISQTTSIMSQFIAYPFDTTRTRMQLLGGGKDPVYKNSRDCVRKIWVEEGFLAFYRGYVANICRSMGCALCLVLYDTIGRFLYLEKDYGKH